LVLVVPVVPLALVQLPKVRRALLHLSTITTLSVVVLVLVLIRYQQQIPTKVARVAVENQISAQLEELV
jgi:hypothetical protein